jgi:hypothetical protein
MVPNPIVYKNRIWHHFSTKVSQKVPKSYPCSNRSVKCDFCNGIYWSYNMKAHHSDKHVGIDFKSLITENEEQKVKNFFNNSNKFSH